MSTTAVTIPGWDDIIHIVPPAAMTEEDRKKKKQQQAIALSMSPQPEINKRLVQYITWLDDAEDLLSTAMILGRPLLRRMPAWATPALGWVLLGKDLVDFAIWGLSLSTTGPISKRNFGEQLKSLSFRRGNRQKKITTFFKHKPGLGALIEGLQVADNFFGVGLCLGPVMGLISDVIWGAIRTAGGKRVKIRVPAQVTPEAKAAKFIYQSINFMIHGADLPKDEQIKLLAAIQIAGNIIVAARDPISAISKFLLTQNEPAPQFIPNDALTREVLIDMNIDPDRDELPITPEPSATPIPIKNWVDDMASLSPSLVEAQHILWGRSQEGDFMTMGALEILDIANRWIEDEEPGDVWHPNNFDMVLKTMVEYGYSFWPGIPPWRILWIVATIIEDILYKRTGIAISRTNLKEIFYGNWDREHTIKPFAFQIEKVLWDHGGRFWGIPRLPPFPPPLPWGGTPTEAGGKWKDFLENP